MSGVLFSLKQLLENAKMKTRSLKEEKQDEINRLKKEIIQ